MYMRAKALLEGLVLPYLDSITVFLSYEELIYVCHACVQLSLSHVPDTDTAKASSDPVQSGLTHMAAYSNE